MMLQSKGYARYRTALLVSLGMAAAVGIFVAVYGRQDSFLVVNGFNSPRFDYFFTYFTYLGDGVIWVPLFLYTLLRKREYFIAVLTALLVCTLITHFFKRVVFVDELRPLRALANAARAVPQMQGKDAYVNTFPSGHTSTAFTFALLLAVLIPKRWVAWTAPLAAFFVGYSRVYLAQHFVTDVLAGMIVGIVSSYLGLLLYLYLKKRKAQRQGEASA